MSKISDLYDELYRTKLEESLIADIEKRKLSDQEEKDYKFSYAELSQLKKLFERHGLILNTDFFIDYADDYEVDYGMVAFRIDEGIVAIWADNRGTEIMPSINDTLLLYDYTTVGQFGEPEEIMDSIKKLKILDLERLGIDIQRAVRPEQKYETFDPSKFVYHLRAHAVVENKSGMVEPNYIDIAGLEDVIHHALIGELVDAEENGKHDETDNYYVVGKYKNKPGYEEIPLILNSIDREILQEYFKKHTEDMELFEALRSKDDEILPLEGQEQSIDDVKVDKDVDIEDFVVDLNTYKIFEDKDRKTEIDYLNYADLKLVLAKILRNQIIDTKVVAEFHDFEFCTIGEYSDMPGEEVIAKVLNQIDRQVLQAYFELDPTEIYLFDEMCKKHNDIKPLDEDFVKRIKVGFREKFEENLLREDVVESDFFKHIYESEGAFGEDVLRMREFEQNNAHHCYDLWEHTLRTVEGIKKEGLTDEQFRRLRVAAFFHDIGKPDVATFNEKTGQQVFYGHATHSVDVARPILERMGYSAEEIEQIGFYIGHHDDFISYKSKLSPWMKNHEFIRGIDSDTVSEKIIENKYDFSAMGYSQDQIRYICYTLGHDGQEPTFTNAKGPIDITVNMAEVQGKIDSGDYDSKYIPSEEDYKLLLELCKADAGAQSEVAIQQGKVVGSKKEKLENMNNIQNSIPEAYKSVAEKVNGYYFEQFIKDSAPQALGELRPKVICKDGTEYSIQASSSHYCYPQEDGLKAYDAFEVGEVTDWKTGDLKNYAGQDGVAGFVPAKVIKEIIKAHGGLDKRLMKERVQEQNDVYKPRSEEYEKMVKEASGGNPFIEKIIRYATRKVEVRGKDSQAQKLEEQYIEQLPKNEKKHGEE